MARVRGALRRARSRSRRRSARRRGRGPEHCCGAAEGRRAERALAGADAWITGLRREQAPTRADAELVECDDEARRSWKYNPLADWTERDLWTRIPERDLPYHPLHDAGYESIGCAPCTQPGQRPRGPLGRHRQDRVRAARRCERLLMDPLVIVFGLGVGILIGLTGIGGGSLMTPLLDPRSPASQPVVAIGTDLAYGAITKTLGGWRHLRKGTVDLGVSKWLAVGSVPGALVGVLAARPPARPRTARASTPVLLGCDRRRAADRRARRSSGARCSCPSSSRASVESIEQTRRTKVARGRHRRCRSASILGVTSVGSGALIGLALILVFQLTPHRVVGTDVFHAAILLWAAGLAHLVSGNVDFVLMGNDPRRLAARRAGRHAAHRRACPPASCARRSAACCSARRSACCRRPASTVPPWRSSASPVAVGAVRLAAAPRARRAASPRPKPEAVPA